jgi:hypothetical protein
MKKLFTIIALFTVATAFLSCSKDDESPSNVFTATVDDDEFKADEIEAFIDDDMVDIFAEDKDENYFTIYLNANDFEEGKTYDFEDDFVGSQGQIYYTNEDGDTFYPTSGKVKITKLTESRVEATFECTAEHISSGEEIEIEDGVIKVTLEKD